MMKFDSKEYLPNSEERLEHLRRIINGRPVSILAAGPSIKELEERVGELSEADICYFGINNFFVQEDNILKKINKRFSILIETPDNTGKGLSSIFDKVINFLDRNDNNMLVSSFTDFNLSDQDFDLKKFLDKYDKKILQPGNGGADRTAPDIYHPLHFINGNSLSWMIYLAIIGKASKIVLFGADGYTVSPDIQKTYYHPEEYGIQPQKQLMENTNKGFNPIVPISLRNIYQTYNIGPVPILNCSEVSFYTPFPKVSYEDGLAFLSGKKNARDIIDLRIPTASIIIPRSEDEDKLQNTLNNISKQSYSNYEKIVIHRSSSFLDTIKKALSLVKSKYIFYCPPGHSYPDQDWINSCLEILENRPQISLVCGLTQNADEPWPKKKFIYYWLKKKVFFPSDMLCVRRQVLEKYIYQAKNSGIDNDLSGWLGFSLFFNMNGYLPAFVRTLINPNQSINKDPESLDIYRQQINNYKSSLILKRASHQFRDGDGNLLSGKFYLSVFLLYGLTERINNILPRRVSSQLKNIRHMVRRFYQE